MAFEERRGLVLARVTEMAIAGFHRQIAILFVDKAQAERSLNYLSDALQTAQRDDTKQNLIWQAGDVTIHHLVIGHEQAWPSLRNCPGFIFQGVDQVPSFFIDETIAPPDALQVANQLNF